MKLQLIATDFRFMQFYAHNAHNLISGDTFFEDHEFLGTLYPLYESAYDLIIERMIGLGEKPDLIAITSAASKTLKESGSHDEAKLCFKHILEYEKYICQQIEEIIPGLSEGTRQMLGTMADESEARQYKIKQRIK